MKAVSKVDLMVDQWAGKSDLTAAMMAGVTAVLMVGVKAVLMVGVKVVRRAVQLVLSLADKSVY